MVAQPISDIVKNHVTLELEAIDRLYLNGYVPGVQYLGGVLRFLRDQLDARYYSTALLAPLTRRFVQAIETFALEEGLDLLTFRKGQRKDDVAHWYRERFQRAEGVYLVGKSQEKTPVFRTVKMTDANGYKYPWITHGSAMVNHYYFYILDRDFGPLFIKFCSYFPYSLKVCLNGHEWLKRQLSRRGFSYEPLDNGIRSAASPERVQEVARELGPRHIRQVIRKWLDRLPCPYRPKDMRAGYRYDLSILQAELSLTQVFDRPQTGRVLFEEVLRENLDLGRPDRIQLIFDQQVRRNTPGSFRTKVITKGVIPSLRVQYKHSGIKQYYKEGRALRTETTINDTRDFGIGKRLHNLPALQQVGFQANRRLLRVQTTSHDCSIGHEALESLTKPPVRSGQRASALRLGDPRITAVLQALTLFCLVPNGFTNRELRELLAQLLGLEPAQFKPGRMTYELRRLRLHGIIQRIPRTQRYRVTSFGLRVAFFYSRTSLRLLRPCLSLKELASLQSGLPSPPSSLGKLQAAYDAYARSAHFAA
jgi:hypothetical protein